MTSDELSRRYLQELKRCNFVTPKNFLGFLANYSKLLHTKRDDIDDIVKKFKVGLERLQRAREDVAVLGKDLAIKEVELDEKTRTNQQMIARTRRPRPPRSSRWFV